MKPIHRLAIALFPLITLAAGTQPATSPATAPAPAIKELTSLTPTEAALKASSATKPLVLKSERDATDYFSKEDLAKLTKQVDFTTQIVLVFAWQGSGQDKLDYSVAESYPEQIRFTYTPGRTRDLRPHTGIYAVRANVTWSAK